MPNFLIIVSDQHSRSLIGAYGNDVIRTPNLDALAESGVRFDQAYCAAPLCVPSRMSFLTSQTPSRNRVWDNTHMLDPDTPTWVHAMNDAGYETALVGRMHFVGNDHKGGFQERPLGEYSACPPGTQPEHPYLWKHIPTSTSAQDRSSVEISGKGHTFYQWFDEQVTEAACQYLEKKRDSDKPFAAVVGYVLPHCPFFGPPELFDYYWPKVEVPEIPDDLPPTIQRFRKYRGIDDPPISEQRIRIARTAYFALCEYLDMQIGKVLEALRESRLEEDTVVIYASDHGEMAGEKGCWWKSNFYEDSVGIPLIISDPRGENKRRSVSEVCNLMDVGPTVCDMAGAVIPSSIDGRSLKPLLEGDGPKDWENETFSEFVDTAGDSNHFPARMIRSGRWKLWELADEDNLPPSLFDLETDPEEMHDLWGQPEYEEVGQKLLAKLREEWDPEWVHAEAKKNLERYQEAVEWGRKNQPRADYLLVPPKEDLEADLDFLN